MHELLKLPNTGIEYDEGIYNHENKESDEELNSYVLANMQRSADGRLTVPLLWNGRVNHLLGRNLNLSKKVLQSNLTRLHKSPHKLALYDEAIKSHVTDSVIEKIENLKEYLTEHPNVSFIPHMGVFRLNHESTKCRIVLLSNLGEKGNYSISHNQAMMAGTNLNDKISTALTKLRFDNYLLSFDIKRAFLNINLKPIDQDKLLILWYNNVHDPHSELCAFKYLRLPFGLKCSPNLLMLCLYRVLVDNACQDNAQLKELKTLLYDLTYMDNCSVTFNDPAKLLTAYEHLDEIFNPYGFYLQQFITNHEALQERCDSIVADLQTPETVKLLGLKYNRLDDTLSTEPIHLSPIADTKRAILSSIASNYDVLQINGPMLNRARLFVHKLQSDPEKGWDEKVTPFEKKEWLNIANQANNSPSCTINRNFGSRNSEYELLVFCDSSKVMLGQVAYLKEVPTGKLTFVQGKNKLVTKALATKTIPCLELHALALGVELLADIRNELAGDKTFHPLKITRLCVYSDSMVALSWVNSYVNKLDKTNKRTPFVMNRINAICAICDQFPVTFKFIAGHDNPADLITRPVSYKLLKNSCYHSGPSMLVNQNASNGLQDTFEFQVPNPIAIQGQQTLIEMKSLQVQKPVCVYTLHDLLPIDKFSSFSKLISVVSTVLRAVNRFKSLLKQKANKSSEHIKVDDENINYQESALQWIIKIEQSKQYPDICNYFASKETSNKSIPNLVTQLNLFLDENGIIRVRSKFKSWRFNHSRLFPALLGKNSQLTQCIIKSIHIKHSHAGIYTVLSHLRKKFFIPSHFSVVKRALRQCCLCKRFNERTVKLNQSCYRRAREDPPQIPFRYVFIDHFGPYKIKGNKKAWILCITCMWCRAINLKICSDLTIREFLRVFQIHIFEHGIPEKVFSDLGSQLVASGNIVTDLLKDSACHEFFVRNEMTVTTFDQYFKGNSALGGLVESCVKLCKKLIYGSIGKLVLDKPDLELIIAQTVHIVNKRPVAFYESLRQSDANSVSEPITPELLLRGYDCPALNIIPEGMAVDADEEWILSKDKNLADITSSFRTVQKVRENLKSAYHDEFLGSLLSQAVRVKDRYKPVLHKPLRVGDIVLLKEDNMKSVNYPMAIVTKIIVNDLGETTNVIVRKGNRESVKRHVQSVIPYLARCTEHECIETKPTGTLIKDRPPKRKAAIDSEVKTKQLFNATL